LESLHLRRGLSRGALLRMVILAAAGIGLLAWRWDFINELYLRDQLTPASIVINGAILGLFFLGVAVMAAIFIRYDREEAALFRLLANHREDRPDLLADVAADSIIARRYRTMEKLHASRVPIDHSALASTLVATESTRNTLPRFINSSLILTGVFGTIVALSIALFGASDMLKSAVDAAGLGVMVHGMSTALATTITAILCYLYFGYFYLQLTDVQTNLVSGVEQVTTSCLLPRFQVRTENVLHEFMGLIKSMQGLVKQMEASQSSFENIETHILSVLESSDSRADMLSGDMADIKELLQRGFRLSGQQ